jgi:VCBS repeat-containing protein
VSSDADIARREANVLDWDSSCPKDRVQVEVQSGIVTLTGDVDWRYESDQARRLISALARVKSVSNLLQVKTRVADGDVKQRIERALFRSAEVEGKSLRIHVLDGRVILEGTVDSRHDRDVADTAAWSAPSVKEVIDNIRIY